jgi:hypothetical protein
MPVASWRPCFLVCQVDLTSKIEQDALEDGNEFTDSVAYIIFLFVAGKRTLPSLRFCQHS